MSRQHLSPSLLGPTWWRSLRVYNRAADATILCRFYALAPHPRGWAYSAAFLVVLPTPTAAAGTKRDHVNLSLEEGPTVFDLTMMWTPSVDIHQVLMVTRSGIGLMLIHGLHTHLLNRYTSCPYSLTTSSYRQRSLIIILLTYLTITYPKPPMSRGVRPIRSWKSSTHGTPPPTYIVKPLIGCPIVDGSMGDNGYMCKRTEVRIHGSPLMPSPDSSSASGIPVSALCSHEDATYRSSLLGY